MTATIGTVRCPFENCDADIPVPLRLVVENAEVSDHVIHSQVGVHMDDTEIVLHFVGHESVTDVRSALPDEEDEDED